MSWRATVHCTRGQAEAAPELELDWPSEPPVLVADEPDPAKPDEWLLHAYFEHEPGTDELAAVEQLGTTPPQLEALGEADWVTMSQQGLEPIQAGRFFVHTPTHAAATDAINFEIDAGLASENRDHHRELLASPLADEVEQRHERMVTESIAAQRVIEAGDTVPFESYRQHYLAQPLLVI